jgi:signal transduction histidine kinase/CheY-like chemotaxis protein
VVDAPGDAVRFRRLHQLVESLHDFTLDENDLGQKLTNRVEALLELANALTIVRELEKALATMQARLEESQHTNEKASFLMSVVSHELRTPLAGIFGLLDLLQETDLDADQRGYFGRAYESLLNMSQILDDNLDFSKLEAGKTQITNASFNVLTFLEDLADFVRPWAQKKNIAFNLEIRPDFPTHIVLDKLRLRQILLNLLTNALKYTDSGSVTLQASCAAASVDSPAPGTQVAGSLCSLVFTVTDTGRGMTPQQQRDLFQPFYQVRAQQSTTGLGLFIASNLASLLNGELVLDSSAPGVGSSFSLALRHVEFGVPPHTPQSAPTSEVGHPDSTGKTSILLAEDDPTIGFVMKKVLSRLGHTVDLVENGYLAVEAVRAAPIGHYRLVFMDLQMPVMGGTEALRHIKALPGAENLPVVAMTADIMAASTPMELQQLGFSAVLGKPFVRSMLQRIIGEVSNK